MPFKSGCRLSLGKSLHEALLQRPLHFDTLNSPAVRKPSGPDNKPDFSPETEEADF